MRISLSALDSYHLAVLENDRIVALNADFYLNRSRRTCFLSRSR